MQAETESDYSALMTFIANVIHIVNVSQTSKKTKWLKNQQQQKQMMAQLLQQLLLSLLDDCGFVAFQLVGFADCNAVRSVFGWSTVG